VSAPLEVVVDEEPPSAGAPPAPDLDDVAGDWVEVGDLAHLPSLRNQCGQGHVNVDLSSMSWLAAPPYTFGYHTGVLRLDGVAVAAQRFCWKPWGVRREHRTDRLVVRTDTRMVVAQDLLLWHIEVTNTVDEPVECTVSQDLFAMVARTDTGWGWLYDVPWTAGNYHDFMTLERIRATTAASNPEAGYLVAPGSRRLRLGKPRLPGIQRDSDVEVMEMSYELPRHVSQDTLYPHQRAAEATVRGLRCRTPHGVPAISLPAGDIVLEPATEVVLSSFELSPGLTIEFEVRLEAADQTGIVLTHGNHPDSLQLGVECGRLWLGISGEKEYVEREVDAERWHAVMIHVEQDRVTMSVDGEPAVSTGHWSTSPRWKSLAEGDVVNIADSLSSARASYGFDTKPDTILEQGAGARATWTIRLEPGQTRTIGVACAYGDDAADVVATASNSARQFADVLAATEHGWRRLWQAMFTPGNREFSGHLPVLDGDDPGVARSYYMGALLALYMRNTRVSHAEPIFLTGGPRLGPTTTYFWDHTEWSRLYALLEPVGLRSWLRRALSGPYESSFGFDTRNGGPLGNWYVANDYALFRLVEHYVCVTGDAAFLDEPAGSVTIFDHLDRLAHGWADKRNPETGGVLADFGPDPWTMLECVPNYVNVVASFNAAYVGMMRSFAALLRLRGRSAEAGAADGEADRMARAVIAMALPSGRWQIRHPASTEAIGHCLDFGLIAAHLHADLSQPQRDAMTQFVADKLLASTWMRALALDDPAAPLANRPDHGATGAFGAWLGVTAYGLAKLGRQDLAAPLLGVAHESASGGLWGQAMEIVSGADGPWVRVAEAGVSNRDSVAGVATAEAVLAGLFGFEPSFAARLAGTRLPDRIHVAGAGTMWNINVGRRP
jgi:hypothetical protein